MEEISEAAQTDESVTREEVQSLRNLIERLDFNHYFKPPADIRAMLSAGTI